MSFTVSEVCVHIVAVTPNLKGIFEIGLRGTTLEGFGLGR
jgi:hypothetical protein